MKVTGQSHATKIAILAVIGLGLLSLGCGRAKPKNPSFTIHPSAKKAYIQEQVTLNVSTEHIDGPISVSWTLADGAGSITPTTGVQVIYTAPKLTGIKTISATLVAGDKILSNDLPITIVLPDRVGPAAPEKPVAKNEDDKVIISWTANTEADLAGYKVFFSTISGQYPTSKNVVDVGNKTTYTFGNLNNGTLYYFQVVAYDKSGNASPPSTQITQVPRDKGPPGQPILFTVKQSGTGLLLTWLSPTAEDFRGVRILRGTTEPTSPEPSTPNGIIQVYEGKAESFTDTTVSGGVFYYYSAFSFDEIPNYSDPATSYGIVQH